MSWDIFPVLLTVLAILILILIGMMVDLVIRSRKDRYEFPAATYIPAPSCPHCGNTAITVDASAVWDHHKAGWVMYQVHGTGECNACHREFQQVK